MYESTKRQQSQTLGELRGMTSTPNTAGMPMPGIRHMDKIHSLEDARSVVKGLIEATRNKMDIIGWHECTRQLEKALTHLEDARMWFGKSIEALEETK